MPEVSGEETNKGAETGFDEDKGAGFVTGGGPEFEFATVAGLPIGIEVEDGGDDAVTGAGVAIKMGLVKSAFRIDGEVAFELEQAQEEALVEGKTQEFKFGEITVLFEGGIPGLQPHDLIPADVLTDFEIEAAPNSGALECPLVTGVLAFLPQAGGICRIKTPWHRGPTILLNRIQKG